jgi:predicted NodU family carbamoyl transferase
MVIRPADVSVAAQRIWQGVGDADLVNTSFNGFREPIVCSPRDAI